MASRSFSPESALVAAGIVGQWEVDAKTETVILDRAAALYFFGDEAAADTPLPLSEMFARVSVAGRNTLMEYCAQLLASGGPATIQTRVRSAASGERTVQVRGYFAWEEGGAMIGRGIMIDVTDDTTHALVPTPLQTPLAGSMPLGSADPLIEAAEQGIALRTALGRSGHGALRLAADLLLFEINTAMAARHTVSDKPMPHLSKAIGDASNPPR